MTDERAQSTLAPILTDMSTLADILGAKLPFILIGLTCFIVAFILSGPISRLLVKPVKHFNKSELVALVTKRLISLLIVLLGAYVLLRLSGLTEFAIAVASGTGLAGLIVGFAFKDIAENFISSLLLSVQKPFKIGDVVDVASNTGVISRVTSRATTLVDFDGNHIQIPNAVIYKSIIKNYTANPKMRSHFVIGIGYDASASGAQQLALDILLEHSAILDKPKPQVLVDSLGSSTLNLKVYFWIDSDKNSILKVRSVIQRSILEAFETAGIPMPDDARERIIKYAQDDDVASLESKSSHLSSKEKDANSVSKTRTSGSQNLASREQHVKEDDLESEVSEIKEQAQQSRSPEQGDNIL
ncbi:mechanosensitive ion channel family protein [Ningiella sp. W23]|uniref:mechanosensitive ion channel family protein n=1 Tax=Ningiella sp. W23 TaxID=3023715 RepID=UPI003756310D